MTASHPAKPGKAARAPNRAYDQLIRVVRGAVRDTFNFHPDYLTRKGRRLAPGSLVKRVTGTVLGFAVQAAEGQRKLAASGAQELPLEPQASGDVTPSAGAGALTSSAPSYPRLRRVVRLNPELVRKHRMGRVRQAALIAKIEATAALTYAARRGK